jgi:phenylpropionate dioxygenase-like ring-hydroxylating dioxygenase large terminal subunit
LAGCLPVEELPKVGDYVTYDIMDESIIIVRTAPDRLPPITTSANTAAGG